MNGSLLHSLPGITCCRHYFCPSDGLAVCLATATEHLWNKSSEQEVTFGGGGYVLFLSSSGEGGSAHS